MFCAFAGATDLRLYGQGKVLSGSFGYSDLLGSAFDNEERPGSRQIVVLTIDLVQTSCGYGVPLFEYVDERRTLTRWAEAKGEAGWKSTGGRKMCSVSTDTRLGCSSPLEAFPVQPR